MTVTQIIETLKEYKNYHRISKHDKKHIEILEVFIIRNIDNIKNCTWYDMAGGFMMFAIQINNSTYTISNNLFDGVNDTILWHNLSLKGYIELNAIDYDMGILLQQEMLLKNQL